MKKLILCMILALVGSNAYAFEGLVRHCHDGDTCSVVNELGKAETIRLYRADSPELPYKFGKVFVPKQPYADEAHAALDALCTGKIATITRKGTSYSRTVGIMVCDGQDAAFYQVSHGNAWAYRYSSIKATRAAQAKAKAEGLGLWALPNPIEPYRWRRGVRE